MPVFNRLFAFSLALLLLFAVPLRAQTPLFSTLTADSVSFNSQSGLLSAEGHVVVIYKQNKLEADSLTYNQFTGEITATGPLRITDGTGAVFTATMATLSPDLSAGIIRGAQLLLNNQFQIAAAEIRRSSNRFNTLYRTVGSACTVDINRPVPLWQVRSERIIHDTEKQRLYFEDARFEVLGLPIAFLPRLRMPDPSVQRATGLLAPLIISSEIYGYGIKLPYFLTFGDHADATITPFITTGGAFLLEGEYRRQFSNGGIEIHGAFSLTNSENDVGDGFIESDVIYGLNNGAELYVDLAVASSDSYMRRYGYSDADRLVSSAGIRRYQNESMFEAGAVFFQSVSPQLGRTAHRWSPRR